MPTRVLIVDDSKAMCTFLAEILGSDPDLEVVGFALDPFEARSMIKQLHPDVLTLDVEMPRMDGITFLKNLMRLHPMPVVMLSSLTAAGAAVTLEALSVGAVDFMVKRHPGSGADYQAYVADIVAAVKGAGSVKPNKTLAKGKACVSHPDYLDWRKQVKGLTCVSDSIKHVIAIGASTGGPEAVRTVLESLYAADVAVLLSQHMPARFMGPFADRLDSYSKFKVAEAVDDAPLLPGCCYVAPGDRHLELRGRGANLRVSLSDAPACSGHRPSVDVMFHSLAAQAGASSLGLLLTGMGHDGAQGMLALHRAGAFTMVQDEQSSAVWGMPGSAVALGAVRSTLTLRDIGPTLQALVTDNESPSSPVVDPKWPD